MKPQKNNSVFTEKVDYLYLAVNPLIPKGLQLINQIQKDILELSNGKNSINKIARKLKLSKENVEKAITVLEKKEFLSLTGEFKQPELKEPKGINIWLHSTNACTLRCTYCHVHQNPEHMTAETFQELERNILQTIQEKNLHMVGLRVAGGEPMKRFSYLKTALPALKQKVLDAGCKFKAGFSTNLTILNDEIINFLKENNFGVAVSLDGINEYHDQTRIFPNKAGSFKVIEKNLERLILEGFRPRILTVVSEENIDGLEDFTKYLIERDLGVRYSFIRGDFNLDTEKLTQVMLRCYDLMEEAIQKGYNFSKKHQLCDTKLFRPAFQVCGAGRNTFSAYTDGSLHVCHTIHDQEKPFGSVNSECNLLDLSMNQEQFSGLLENSCDGCQFKFNCAAGCPLEKKDGKSPYCEVFKVLIPRVYQLIGKQRLLKLKP